MVWINVGTLEMKRRSPSIVGSGAKLAVNPIERRNRTRVEVASPVETTSTRSGVIPSQASPVSVILMESTMRTVVGSKMESNVVGIKHLTGFHWQWSSNVSAFSLAEVSPTHKLVLKAKLSSSAGTLSGSSSISSGNGPTNAVVNTWHVPNVLKSKLLQLNDNVRTPNKQIVMDQVMKELSLN